ncbi:MAG: Ig-like domain-containing protein [Longimicrobiales bacterium]
MKRTITLLVVAALAAAACTPDSAGPADNTPPEIARITVSPEATSVARGATVSLTANLEDEDGYPIHDRTVEWLTYDATVATVSSSGVVTGMSAGTATITATAEGKRGSARVTVTAPPTSGLAITALSPNPFVEGQAAIINGSGFGFVPSNLRVTIDGVTASITATNGTSIQIVVPQTGCKPARTVDVQVRLLASYSNIVKHPLRPAQMVGMPVGQQLLIRDPAQFCMQFGASSAAEAYLIGVQSTAEQVTTLTPVTLAASVASANGAGDVVATAELAASRPLPNRELMATLAADNSWRRRAAEARIRKLDWEFLRSSTAPAAAAHNNSVASLPTLPASARVGDVVTVRVPAFEDQCNNFSTTTAVVRAITPRSIWLEDPANPAGGFSAADIQSLANLFESVIYDTDIDYFGATSDMDRNGRVAIIITKEVNRLAAAFDPLFDLGGMVKPVNHIATSACPASNEGEIIYLRAPDPTGRFGRVTPGAAEELRSHRVLLAHEFVHAIQWTHMVPGSASGAAVQPNWLVEGQATLAEEVVGHRITGRSTGRNYGFDVAYNRTSPDQDPWYRAVSWMGIYYGGVPGGSRVANAPEQCSWLGMAAEGNNGPCASADIATYAVGWSFLRWLSDRFGPQLAGGEKALQRALVNNRSKGFSAVSGALGIPIDSLLAQWGAALYVDDRVPTLSPALTFSSWNMFDVENGKNPLYRLLPRERSFASFTDAVSVRAGSTAYFRVSGVGRPATAIQAFAPSSGALPAHMRMWVVRLQ